MAAQQLQMVRLDETSVQELALLCKALGHPVRVRLLKHLIDCGTCYFGDLSDLVPLAASTVSQHVTILKEAGLVCGAADEQRVCYCVNPERLALLQRLVQAL